MTIDEFIKKYNGGKWDYDFAYGFQCVDLYDFYCKEVVGCPIILVNGAKDIWNNYPVTFFDKIPNTPDGIPNKGDVMIWGSSYGQFGHVAIVIDANLDTFQALSQNDPIERETYIRNYQYTAVLGWLHPKQLPINLPSMNEQDKKDIESMHKLREYNGVWYEVQDIIKDYEKVRGEKNVCDSQNQSLNAKNLNLDKALKEQEAICISQIAKVKEECQVSIKKVKDNIKSPIKALVIRILEVVEKL